MSLVLVLVLAYVGLQLLLGLWVPGPLRALIDDAVAYLQVRP